MDILDLKWEGIVREKSVYARIITILKRFTINIYSKRYYKRRSGIYLFLAFYNIIIAVYNANIAVYF